MNVRVGAGVELGVRVGAGVAVAATVGDTVTEAIGTAVGEGEGAAALLQNAKMSTATAAIAMMAILAARRMERVTSHARSRSCWPLRLPWRR